MKLKFLTLLISIAVAFSACEQELDSELNQLISNEKSISELESKRTIELPEYMPLNYVPEWVKEKVTPEEYELWKTLSSKYKISYSFLEMDLKINQKADLYSTVKTLCKDIESGIINEDMGLFVVQKINLNIDTINKIEKLNSTEDGGKIKHHSYPEIIYTATSVSHACVRITATYYTNSAETKVVGIGDATAYADGQNAISYSGSCSVDDYGPVMIKVSCSGTLKYRISNDRNGSESFKETLNIKVIAE